MRALVRETRVNRDGLVQPLFIVPGRDVEGADRVDAGRVALLGRCGRPRMPRAGCRRRAGRVAVRRPR